MSLGTCFRIPRRNMVNDRFLLGFGGWGNSRFLFCTLLIPGALYCFEQQSPVFLFATRRLWTHYLNGFCCSMCISDEHLHVQYSLSLSAPGFWSQWPQK